MKKLNSNFVSITALVLSIAAIAMCAFCCCGKKGASSIEAALNENPEIVINAMQNYEKKMMEKQMAEAQKALEESQEELKNPTGGVIANPEGTITLVKFFDFSCGYCKQVHPALKNIAKNNPNVKIVAKELTFLGPISQYAAKAVLAAKEQGKYAEVYEALITSNARLTEAKIDELAVLAGADLEKLKADMNSPVVEDQLKATNELAAKIQIRGVPTLVLNGQLLQTIDEGVIQKAIDEIK